MRRLIFCLDGTWNNTYVKSKREDGSKVVKPSNVLKFARAILPKDSDNNIEQIIYYDIGVGSLSKFPGITNTLLHYSDKILGGGWGAGFESNLEDAITFLVNNYQTGDQIYICGFSRGATTARALVNFIHWMGGIPVKRDAYYVPRLLRYYVDNKSQKDSDGIKQEIDQELKKDSKGKQGFNAFLDIQIEFLGVWDSVLSLGGRITSFSHREFHIREQPAPCVKHIRHALAIDEKRADFYPLIWKNVSYDAQDLKQMWFAGVHSNIGGGYANDGLANVAFRWMINEIIELDLGLKFDQGYTKFFRAYCQDEISESKTGFYKIKDKLFGKKTVRPIFMKSDDEYKNANLSIHSSVIWRLQADPDKQKDGKTIYPRLTLYRPENLLNALNVIEQKGELQEFLETFDKSFNFELIKKIIKK